MVYVSGSSGYSIDCSGGSSTSSFGLKKQGVLHSSFLESKRVDPIIDVCFAGSGSTSQLSTAPFVDIQLDGAYIVRGVDFSGLSVGNPVLPQSWAFNTRQSDSGMSTWFLTQKDADAAAAWSNLPLGSNQQLDTDIAGQYIRVVPKLDASAMSASGYGFGFELFGCSVAATSLVSFQFKSSKSAILQQYKSTSAFVTQLTQFVCLITKFTTAPGSCARVVYSSIAEGSVTNPLWSGVGPTTLPTIEVTYRILPPSSTCVDCRTASVVQSQLASDLSTPSSRASSIMRALDAWVEDPDPYTCYNKVCDDGKLCVNGACVGPSELETQTASQLAIDSQIQSSSQIDNTLQLSPLSVIADADQTSGVLSFSKTPVQAGTVVKVSSQTNEVQASAAVAPTTTSSQQTFLQRFMIPISVASGVALLIAGIVFWKVYTKGGPGTAPV